MELEAFKNTLRMDRPPEGLGRALEALWHQGKGDWHAAHKLAQAQDDEVGAWVHAHLHRIEGDERNAGYWYRRAGRPFDTADLDDEWDCIASTLLERYGFNPP